MACHGRTVVIPSGPMDGQHGTRATREVVWVQLIEQDGYVWIDKVKCMMGLRMCA